MRVQQFTGGIAGLKGLQPQQTGMVPLQTTTIPAQTNGFDINSIMNLMMMMMVMVMMMKMMAGVTSKF
ncbi:MAG: hypothetical protein ACOC58_00105 [Chloroflexota bacterium]